MKELIKEIAILVIILSFAFIVISTVIMEYTDIITEYPTIIQVIKFNLFLSMIMLLSSFAFWEDEQ